MQSVISIKLQRNFIEIALRHGCSPVHLLHIFRTPFLKNNSGWLLLKIGAIITMIVRMTGNLQTTIRFQRKSPNQVDEIITQLHLRTRPTLNLVVEDNRINSFLQGES